MKKADPLQLQWERDRSVAVNDAAELDAAIEAIERDPHRPAPVMVFLSGPVGFLSIGVGDPAFSVLMYGTHDRRTPLHAIWDEAAWAAHEDRPFLTFSSYGRPVKFAKWCRLPKGTAKLAARSFLEQGGVLWAGVRWEHERKLV